MRGSVTFFDNVFCISLYAVSHSVHWFHIVPQEYVKGVGLSGMGYNPEFTLYISIHFFMDDMSDNLVESLALQDWEEKERNAMVASMASMTITTMSSTRVKAIKFVCEWDFGFSIFCLMLYFWWGILLG